MFKAITDFFSNELQGGSDAPEASESRVRTAAGALLLELAWADGEFSEQERQTVTAVLRDRFDVPADRIADLLARAERERDASTDLYQFTRLIRERCSDAEVLRIVESLWRVVYSDGALEAHEDALMHKLGRLMGLDHRELIALKLRAAGDR